MNDIAPNVISDGIPYVVKILNMIGPFLSGIGILIASILAVLTYIFIHSRSSETEWMESFRTLYEEFWKDSDITQIRRCITNNKEYDEIKGILKSRLSKEQNDLEEKENDILEKVDRFCSIMIRIRYFEKTKMSAQQKELYFHTYESFWIDKIKIRQELREYIEKYWPELSSWLNNPSRVPRKIESR